MGLGVRGRRHPPHARRRSSSGASTGRPSSASWPRWPLAMGLRSGSHGGPLVFEAADVQHVLLAPGRPWRGGPRHRLPAAPRRRGDRRARGRRARRHRRRPHARRVRRSRSRPGCSPGPPRGAADRDHRVVERAPRRRASDSGASTHRSSASRSSAGRSPTSPPGTSTSPFTRTGAVALAPIASVDVVGVLAGARARHDRAGARRPASRWSRRCNARASCSRCASRPRSRTCARSSRSGTSSRTRHPASDRGSGCRRRPGPGRATWRRDWHGALRWPVSRVARIATLTRRSPVRRPRRRGAAPPRSSWSARSPRTRSRSTSPRASRRRPTIPTSGSGSPSRSARSCSATSSRPTAILAGAGVLGVVAAVVTAAFVGGHSPAGGAAVDRDRRGRRARRDAGGGGAVDVPRPARPRPRGRHAAPGRQLRAPGRAGGDDGARVPPDRRGARAVRAARDAGRRRVRRGVARDRGRRWRARLPPLACWQAR